MTDNNKEFADWMEFMEDTVSKVYGLPKEKLTSGIDLASGSDKTARIIVVGAGVGLGKTCFINRMHHEGFHIIEHKPDMLEAMIAMGRVIDDKILGNRVIQLSEKYCKTMSFKTWKMKKIKLPRKRKKACIGSDGRKWYFSICLEYQNSVPATGTKFPKRYNAEQNW